MQMPEAHPPPVRKASLFQGVPICLSKFNSTTFCQKFKIIADRCNFLPFKIASVLQVTNIYDLPELSRSCQGQQAEHSLSLNDCHMTQHLSQCPQRPSQRLP